MSVQKWWNQRGRDYFRSQNENKKKTDYFNPTDQSHKNYIGGKEKSGILTGKKWDKLSPLEQRRIIKSYRENIR